MSGCPDSTPMSCPSTSRSSERWLIEPFLSMSMTTLDTCMILATRTRSSNALFRLGDDKLVRLPRQPGGASIDKEASWLPYVAARVTVEVPAIVGVGEPDLDYPERWAITTWLHGSRPSIPRSIPRGNGTDELAAGLVHFPTEMRGMEVPDRAKDDKALSWYRGLPLWDLDADFREAAVECRDLGIGLDIDEALRVWDRAVDASRAVEPVNSWYHGDLLASIHR